MKNFIVIYLFVLGIVFLVDLTLNILGYLILNKDQKEDREDLYKNIRNSTLVILISILLTIVTSIANADVGVGLDSTKDSLGFTASETNFFDRNTRFKRYGAGHSRFVVGNSTGVRILSSGGFVLANTGNLYSSPANLFVGLGMGNFTGNLTTKDTDHDFYAFYPGVDGGFFVNIHSIKSFLSFSFKAGYMATDAYSNQSLQPNVLDYYGSQMYLKTGMLDLGYEKIFFGPNKYDSLENHVVILRIPRENWENDRYIVFKRQVIDKVEQNIGLTYNWSL